MLDALERGGKRALAGALASVEARPGAPETIELLDQAFARPRGIAIGITGPPGAGKSTLVDALIRHWRAPDNRGARTIGVIAVDPSSAASGGALLGDRTRLTVDPADQGVFIRSMAARDRLGGLSAAVFPAMVLMRALYDLVLIETVGVGQSETAVAGTADLVVLCVPPGAGDTLQHMKAGVLEVPDVVVVTKADLGTPAARTRAELAAALTLASRSPPVLACSSAGGGVTEGVAGLAEALGAAGDRLGDASERHRTQVIRWAEQQIVARFGWEGLRRLPADTRALFQSEPFAALIAVESRLSDAFGNPFG